MMTTVALPESATVRDLLFDGVLGDPTDPLANSLHEHGTVKPLVNAFPGLTAAVEQKVASEANALLSIKLVDLAVAGWKRYEALREAAHRTQDAPPTTEEIVALVTHQIESSQKLTVDVLLDGKPVGTVDVVLKVAFDLAGVLAVVSRARLTAVRTGTCTVTGTLSMEGSVVAEGKRGFDLPGAIRLRQGIALLAPVVA
jgi:hypothetical protein